MLFSSPLMHDLILRVISLTTQLHTIYLSTEFLLLSFVNWWCLFLIHISIVIVEWIESQFVFFLRLIWIVIQIQTFIAFIFQSRFACLLVTYLILQVVSSVNQSRIIYLSIVLLLLSAFRSYYLVLIHISVRIVAIRF